MRKVLSLLNTVLVLISFSVMSLNDTTVTIKKEHWERYLENSSDPNHSPVDDHSND